MIEYIYQVVTDSEAKLYVAVSFADAIEQDLAVFLETDATGDLEHDRGYHYSIIDSVTRIGELEKRRTV